MDDERLKNPPGPGHRDYFDELLERIREIRASERRFYQKVLDIYATSIDYKPDADLSQRFFATVQNKMHWATHGHTAAEIIHARADATKPFMGMQSTRPGGIVRKEDAAATIASCAARSSPSRWTNHTLMKSGWCGNSRAASARAASADSTLMIGGSSSSSCGRPRPSTRRRARRIAARHATCTLLPAARQASRIAASVVRSATRWVMLSTGAV